MLIYLCNHAVKTDLHAARKRQDRSRLFHIGDHDFVVVVVTMSRWLMKPERLIISKFISSTVELYRHLFNTIYKKWNLEKVSKIRVHEEEDDDDDLAGWEIALIVIGVILMLLILLCCCFFLCFPRYETLKFSWRNQIHQLLFTSHLQTTTIYVLCSWNIELPCMSTFIHISEV